MTKIKETIVNYTSGAQRLATTVRFTDDEENWEVFTERAAHKTLFEKLFGSPSKVLGMGNIWYVPYRELSIRKRHRRVLSEENRKEASDRMKAILESTKRSKLSKNR